MMIKHSLSVLRCGVPALLLPLLFGCLGTNGGGGTSTAPFLLTVSPSGLSVPAGGGGHATVMVARRRGFSDAIALSLDGAPTGVVGSGTAETAAQTGQLSLIVASEVTPQDLADLRVKGTAGSDSCTVPFHLVITEPLPVGQTSPDQVQASGGVQSGGAFENAAVAGEPVEAVVSGNGTGTAEARPGFDPSDR